MRLKNTIFLSFYIFCGLLVLNSCQTTKILSIDYLAPANVSFPKELKKVGVINNVVTDYTTQETPSQWKDLKALLLGNATIATESLAQHLADANYFDEVVIYDSALQLQKESYENHPLTSDEIKELTDFLQVDFIIALENVLFNAKAVDYITEDGFILEQLEVETNANIKGFLPERDKPLFQDQIKDTIYWDLRDIVLTQKSEKTIVNEASFFTGEVLASRIVPQWNTAQRLLYIDGNKSLRKSHKFIKNNQWEQAYNIWMEIYDSPSKNVKNQMRAALNIAVFYEMRDNFEEAINWATIAKELAYKVDEIDFINPIFISSTTNYAPIKTYLEVLEKRKENAILLNQQMKRFDSEIN